jgi:hypothetical protein
MTRFEWKYPIHEQDIKEDKMSQRKMIEQAIFNLSVGFGMACCCSLGAMAAQAPAPVEHAFTGTVTKLSPDAIELRHGSDTLRFARRSEAAAAPEDLHVGDRVTVYSNLEAQRIKKAPPPKQEAGERGHEILDDRAFYSASTDGS